MQERVFALWSRLPVIVRAPVSAFVVLAIGSVLTTLPLLGNLKFHPEIPWALPATLIVLAGFWLYFIGRGYPAVTRAARREVTRDKSMPGSLWRAALLPILFSIMTVASLRLILPSIVAMEPPHISVDLTPYPFLTVLGLLLSLAISAGVTEEVAFRGYMQKPLEEAYGIIPAILLTAIAFWLAHADKVSLSHLPFHLTASVLLGLLVYWTKSLLPAIVGHAAADALLQPAYVFHQPGFVWSALTATPVWAQSGATSFGIRAGAVWQAMEPSRLLSPSPPLFGVLAWSFVVNALLTAVFFARLARASRPKAPVSS